jgi:glutamyl-tRNA synthetase
MADLAIKDLRWLGIDWDEGPYVQSERVGIYGAALENLKAAGLVYPCTCTRADIARAASAPHAGEEGPVYPGTCAGRSAGDAEGLTSEGKAFAWRFRAREQRVMWEDLVRGKVEIGCGGDFVVGRSDGVAAYQLAVVVDDAAMGVTEVIRGDDLVPSTPRQILLYGALGHEPPSFGHVGLAVGHDGKRLAKRDQSLKLATLRGAGEDPRLVLEAIAKSCGLEGGERAEAGCSRWIDGFRIDRLKPGEWRVVWP